MKKFLIPILTLILLFSSLETIYADYDDYSARTTNTEELVIVLDPGHDATHAGAGGNGLREEKQVLKIGQYLRDELNKYENVKVYMTRETESCPFPETCGVSEGSKRCNEARVAFAKSVGADIYIALHLNSHSSSSANGALAFVPNNNYSSEAGTIGQQLGKTIVSKLGELGLKVEGEGIRIVNSQSDTRPEEFYYPDGSIADYYRVIRYAKKEFIPAIIVEHAFISNASDAANYLSTDEQLMALAIKDAQGIAEYYALSLKDGCAAGTVPEITIPSVPDPVPEPLPETESEIETETTSEAEPEGDTEAETNAGTPTETVDVTETEEVFVSEETEAVEDSDNRESSFPWTVVVVIVLAAAGVTAYVWYKRKK